jgi:hypothetical protein
MRHSFLAWQTEPGRLDVVDAYHNDTSWGAARPVRTELSIVDLPTDAEAFRIGAEPLVAPDVTLVRKANERELAEALDDGVVDRFARAYRDHDDRQAAATAFTLQTWLLARSRALHELWLRRHDEDATAFAKHVECWRRFAERAFIAARRAQRGRRAPADLHDELTELLRLDREHAAPADDAPAHSRAEVTRLVTDTAAMVLAVDAPTLAAVVDLAELPTFNSFRVVALVEQLEDVLGVELDAAVLIPHNLHSLDRLCDLFVDATREDTR